MEEELFTPVIDNELEYPEKYYEIDDEQLQVFKIKKEKEKANKYAAKKAEEVEEDKGKK